MKSSTPKTADANFREAFERLKAGVPKVLPHGTPVSQNNVAKEAGRDSSALRKSRFPGLVADIKEFLASNENMRPPSERQRVLKRRQQSRVARETNADLKIQRDHSASLLVEASAQIGILTRRVRDLEVRVEDLQTKARILPLHPTKPKATPRAMDMPRPE